MPLMLQHEICRNTTGMVLEAIAWRLFAILAGRYMGSTQADSTSPSRTLYQLDPTTRAKA
jgi:hypothetical protein